MSKARKDSVDYRNIRLSMSTYQKLDKFTNELANDRGDRRISLDEAVLSLLDEHYGTPTKSKGERS